MPRVGLALSGGGFRATLYHLGVVRFLRDARILPRISHITTVSGGSVLGAHLGLNWDRYCGSASDFQQAASEVIRLVQLDVRNRIVRRFPLASAVNTVRRSLRLGSCRQLTRAGLLEKHYERFLYGDTALSQLVEQPRLHILATNLSEGCLCSFNRDGLLLQRRVTGKRDRFERVHVGLATVPMAVAASSAFPGFFPPLELSGWDVGTDEGTLDRQAFTDGGIYDNLGLRMLRCIEQASARDVQPLQREDFLELEDTVSALMSASSLPEGTPLHKLRKMLASCDAQRLGLESSVPPGDVADAMIRGLWEVIRSEELYRDPTFQAMELTDPNAQSLLQYVRTSNHVPEMGDRMWINRQIVSSALQQVIGKPCLEAIREGFDAVLVSDAGGKFKVVGESRAGGLIHTALRSSDILMDRVWQMELETFDAGSGLLSIPITQVVSRGEDPLAPHPEIQRQAARIRTDLDRFSDLEISALVQHGYCVARKMLRRHATRLAAEIPSGAPWDPLAPDASEGESEPAEPSSLHQESQTLRIARRMRRSSSRRTWSTLLSFRDWPTYVWLPLLASVFLSLPYMLYKTNQRSRQQEMVLTAIAETSQVYRTILQLLEYGPGQPLGPAPFDEVESLETPDFTGFEIVSDTRIYDLRRWSDSTKTAAYTLSHVRLHVRRTQESAGKSHLRFQTQTTGDQVSLFCRTESLHPVLFRMRQSDGSYRWQLDLDFSHVPTESDQEVILDGALASETTGQSADEGRFGFSVPTRAGLVQMWMLMPEGRRYEYFEISGHPLGKPGLAQVVVPDSKVEMPIGSLVTFRLINPEPNYRYVCRWKWSRQSTPPY